MFRSTDLNKTLAIGILENTEVQFNLSLYLSFSLYIYIYIIIICKHMLWGGKHKISSKGLFEDIMVIEHIIMVIEHISQRYLLFVHICMISMI